ncbi:DUF2637 domain-containing protein [Streptomyces pini]|uniref:DUF2637 domain-containing protein n=1 Tax=Streptomyces pini TaxID=1520580 RepID=A0A1I4MEA1_9ACTN|nr:DUF2637 domain-containing protein [Streptomyces pini]SFM01742.1 Protein of unknown function [Streptomyces pini]
MSAAVAAPEAVTTSKTAAASEARAAATDAPRDRSGAVLRVLAVVAVIGGAAVAAIGFAGSYSALRALAESKGFGAFSPWFPIGVDAGIVALLALDLLLIWRGASWPVLRLLAHAMTAATVYFNANAGEQSPREDPVGALMHAVMPVLFVAAVEAARRVVIRAARLGDGRATDGVPLHRWVMAPWPTWLLYRRMRLWDVRSYPEAVRRERELTVYREMLQRKHGSIRRAPAEERLPLTMAPYGLTIEEALALPAEHEHREQERQAAAEALRLEREAEAERRAAEAEITRLKTRAAVETARHETAAEAGTAEARARAAQTAAEAKAEAEARAARRAVEEAERVAREASEAEESADASEARARALEADRRAAEAERDAAEARARASKADRETAEAKRHAAEAEAARERAEADAAEARARASKARQHAAEAERHALEAEDVARLSPRERSIRRTARMMLAAGAAADPERLPLDTIREEFGVSLSTASQYRTEAADLLAGGYSPQTA